MEKQGKEFRNSYFARLAGKYLPPEDKYNFSLPSPKYKFNIIGTGMMGIEHLRVIYLEGRASIHGIYDPNPRSVAAAQEALSQIDSIENYIAKIESIVDVEDQTTKT